MALQRPLLPQHVTWFRPMTQSSERPAQNARLSWGNHGHGLNLYVDGKYVGTVEKERCARLAADAAEVACEHVHDIRRQLDD